MGKRIIDCKIYTIDYLMNKELTEDDLFNIFDKNSLLYSLVIGMFRHIGDNRSNAEIIRMAKTNPEWVYENFWTTEQRDDYKKKLVKVFENVYQYKSHSAEQKASWFSFMYGLTIKDENA